MHSIYISPSDQNRNYGCGTYGSEMEQMELLAAEVGKALDRCGVKHKICYHTEMGIDGRPADCDKLGYDYYLALHSNAGGAGVARGCVAYYYEAGKNLANTLAYAMKKIGQPTDRWSSVQQNKTFYECRMMAATSVLLEVDFHDTPAGAAFIMARRKDIAEAIAESICAEFDVDYVPPKQETNKNVLYCVQMGAFKNKANAEKLAEKLKKAGYDVYITEKERKV